MLVKEAAEELGVSTWAVWKAIQDKRIKNTGTIGPLITIPRDELDRYKRERRPPGRPPKPRAP